MASVCGFSACAFKPLDTLGSCRIFHSCPHQRYSVPTKKKNNGWFHKHNAILFFMKPSGGLLLVANLTFLPNSQYLTLPFDNYKCGVVLFSVKQNENMPHVRVFITYLRQYAARAPHAPRCTEQRRGRKEEDISFNNTAHGSCLSILGKYRFIHICGNGKHIGQMHILLQSIVFD